MIQSSVIQSSQSISNLYLGAVLERQHIIVCSLETGPGYQAFTQNAPAFHPIHWVRACAFYGPWRAFKPSPKRFSSQLSRSPRQSVMWALVNHCASDFCFFLKDSPKVPKRTKCLDQFNTLIPVTAQTTRTVFQTAKDQRHPTNSTCNCSNL